LKGRYFCFDRHEAKNRQWVLQYRDGNRGLVIEVSPRYGHPSVLAYKVLQAVFRKLTQMYVGTATGEQVTQSRPAGGRLGPAQPASTEADPESSLPVRTRPMLALASRGGAHAVRGKDGRLIFLGVGGCWQPLF